MKRFVLAFLILLCCAASLSADLFTINSLANTISQLDPDSGTVLSTIALPATSGQAEDALAFSGTTLFYTRFSSSEILRINPLTGGITGTIPSPAQVDGLTYGTSSFGDTLYASTPLGDVFLLDPLSGSVFTSFTPSVDVFGGLAFRSATGTLFALNASVVMAPRIHELDATTGVELNTFLLGSRNSFGIAFEGDRLFANNVVGASTLVEFDPDTGTVLNEFAAADPFPSGLAGSPNAVQPVPEPGSIFLLAVGALVWTRFRRSA